MILHRVGRPGGFGRQHGPWQGTLFCETRPRDGSECSPRSQPARAVNADTSLAEFASPSLRALREFCFCFCFRRRSPSRCR